MKLTIRQRQLMAELSKGHSNKQLARTLGLAEGTVKVMLHAIYEQNGVPGRVAAVIKFIGVQQRDALKDADRRLSGNTPQQGANLP